jgi:DNA polymerase III subunit delta'
MILDDIIGQPRAIERLKGYADTESIDGTYLFTGPAGVGKALTAISFAKALNCLTPGSGGCEQCVSCRKISGGAHPDVHFIDSSNGSEAAAADDGSVQIKIGAIRILQEAINYRPYEGRKKIFIINNAHQLNPESANAFLKTLEEPPRDSVIILVTDRPALLLPTVRSRCRVVKFYPIRRNILQESLMKQTAGGRICGEAEAHFLAYFAEGSLGEALKLKDEGLYARKNGIIDSFCDIGSRIEDPVSLASRQDLLRSFNILVSWFRDVYLLKTGLFVDDLIHSDRRQDLTRAAESYSIEELDRVMSLLSESVLHVGRNLNKKLLVSNVIVSCKPSRQA